MSRFFYTQNVWGWDWRGFQLRAYWNQPPQLFHVRDAWCRFVAFGPFVASWRTPFRLNF